jgi:glutamate carboxypeptidase
MDVSLRDKVCSYIEDHWEEQLQFVVDLCSQNSYTYNPVGTNRVAGMLLGRLEAVFHHHDTVVQAETGDHHILRTRQASRGVYILGHMDTVFPPEHSFQASTTEGEWLTGPGVGDMKGGLAVVVYALRALEHAGIMDGLDVTLLLSSDEEIGAVSSRSVYERETSNATACLVAECAGPSGEVVVSRNGKAGLRLDCSGEDQHVASASPGKRSAIVEMAYKVLAIEALNGIIPGVSVNIGRIEGGLGPCTVPAEASCLVDVRWADEKHSESLLGRIRGIIEEPACAGCACNLTVLNHRPAMPLTEGTEALYGVAMRLAGSLGIPFGREHRRGTSDANFFGSAGIPTIDGLGPVCLDDHTARERIHIPSLAERTALLALLLVEVCSGGGSKPF